jgi:hypothetical protein
MTGHMRSGGALKRLKRDGVNNCVQPIGGG